MKLSPHFTLEEMTITQVQDVDNTPPVWVRENLIKTAIAMEAVRAKLGDLPIHVNSGYRSELVNSMVGGSQRSAHKDGWACDFICPAFGSPRMIAEVLVAEIAGINFDQLIMEGTWVHISFAPEMRQEVLTKTRNGYAVGLPI